MTTQILLDIQQIKFSFSVTMVIEDETKQQIVESVENTDTKQKRKKER